MGDRGMRRREKVRVGWFVYDTYEKKVGERRKIQKLRRERFARI